MDAPEPDAFSLRITFVLPNPIRIPMGGAKVVYALAEALAARGHQVAVFGPRRSGNGVADWLWQGAVTVRDRMHRVPDRSYYAAESVTTLTAPSPAPKHVPDADVVIATAWQTAFWVDRLPVSKGRKVYFVQSKDSGKGIRSWQLPLVKIPVSSWLASELAAAGAQAEAAVPPALDPEEFGLDAPVEGRPPHLVAMYHRHPVKAPDVLVAVLQAVRSARPDARLSVFAARPPSHRLPDGVRLHVRPSSEALRALYNEASVFLHTSRQEGLGLPPIEAAACGAAVVAAANGGILSTFTDATARLRPIGDAAGLASAVLELWENEPARVALARAARARVSSRRWDEVAGDFERILLRAR